jgi:hypothetical protein
MKYKYHTPSKNFLSVLSCFFFFLIITNKFREKSVISTSILNFSKLLMSFLLFYENPCFLIIWYVFFFVLIIFVIFCPYYIFFAVFIILTSIINCRSLFDSLSYFFCVLYNLSYFDLWLFNTPFVFLIFYISRLSGFLIIIYSDFSLLFSFCIVFWL